MKKIYQIAFILVLIGAVNWLLVGLFQLDIAAALFNGMDSILSRIVYIIIGFAGLILIYSSLSKKQI